MRKTRLVSEIRECLILAIPLAGAQLAQAATAFVDTVMMGLLGSSIIAAGALGAGLFHMLLIVGSAIVSAVSPLVAEAYGAAQTQQVSRVARQGLWLAVLLAIPITLCIWQGGWLLRQLGQTPENVALAEVYLRAIAWGYLPGLGFAVLRNVVAALSQPRPVIVIMVGGTLFNVVANYVLSFGKLGFPVMGLAGIGWASTLSLWGMFLTLAVYTLQQPSLRHYQMFHALCLDGQVFRELLHIGLPIGILAAVESGLFTMTTLLIGQLGSTALAAHQIALQTAAVTFTIPLGVSIATTVRVGQLIGQRQLSEARLAGFVGISIASMFMAGMGMLFWLFPTQIVDLYIDIRDPANAAVLNLAKPLLGVAAMFQIVDGIQVAAAGALRGLKDTRVPMLIGIFAYWGVGLTSGYVLGLELGLGGIGLWWGLAIGLAVAATILTWRFSQSRAWKELELV